MPIYEYRCENGHLFEVMQPMSAAPVTKCQVCGAPVERLFSPIAVHFKGSGFYATDYGSKKRSRELTEAGEGTGKHAKEDGSASSSKSDSDSKPEPKSDSKPDAPKPTATKSGTKSSSAD